MTQNSEMPRYLIVVSLFDLLINSGLLALINALNACWINLFILFQQWYYRGIYFIAEAQKYKCKCTLVNITYIN